MTPSRLLTTWFAALAILGGGCADNAAVVTQGSGGGPGQGSGGAISTGGTTSSGGAVASGGTTSSGGSVSTGGTTSSGGVVTSGGTTGSGGRPTTGGATGSGGRTGRPGTGGAPDTGGTVGSGGTTAPGGTTETGGQTGTGGVASGGAPATGGTVGTGGRTGTGGAGTGGRTGTGGSTGTGDARAPGNPPVPSAGCGKTPTLKSGTQTITSASLSRQYIIDIPSDYDNSKPYRLIFGFHWMGGTMTDVATGQTVKRDVWAYYGLKRLDSPRSAIFVAPQGIDNGWANTNGRDLTFTDDMVKAITDDLCIDTSRVFTGGFSYGGMWSSTLACQRRDVFRAVAPQNGSGSCSNAKPLAFIGIGSKDGTNTSLQNYARTFAKANGCADPNQAVTLPTVGSHLHTCMSFEGCPPSYPVRFCAFDQNHKAAPCDGCTDEQDNGDTTWAPGEVWKFYTQF